MPAFKNSFLPTLRLEEGMCFTVLKKALESEVASFSEKLEFTIWSPECYSAQPTIPSDILAYANGEMRIYHASSQSQIDHIFHPQKSGALKVCGYRPRSTMPFVLSGVSFSEELPADMMDIPASVLELTGYALDDLCGIINEALYFTSLLDSSDQFESLFEKVCKVLPRVTRVLTDDLDEVKIEAFKNEIIHTKAYRNKKQFFRAFYTNFLRDGSDNEILFVELMIQRAQAVALFTQSESTFDFLKATKPTLKPLLASIDIIIYKNFIDPLMENATNPA